jgi:chromosome segregation protein
MEDVIFAGTQLRKPVGFAYVAITLDNSDHALPVEYDEVVVSRRVFRSGESEYKINGNGCRLKDVAELFYDTGIGKEGYSIIGQGQIDKILSGKPEERRELFDEAAGIVKFKRRKAASVKKLENERANLVRVNDILAELEKQVGPLERQSEKAKKYLSLKEELKRQDANAFLLENDESKKSLAELEEKIGIAAADLEKANADYESTKAEYEALEHLMDELSGSIEMTTSLKSNTELEKQRLDGQVGVSGEQIKAIRANEENYRERLGAIAHERQQSGAQRDRYEKDLQGLEGEFKAIQSEKDESEAAGQSIRDELAQINSSIEAAQQDIFRMLDEKTNIKTENQRFQTMLEQYSIRRSELNGKVIQGKSLENDQVSVINGFAAEVKQLQEDIDVLVGAIKSNEQAIGEHKDRIAALTGEADRLQQQYHREKSRMESLLNIAERYEGYGNSIRRVMELKESKPGILGVVADIIKVQKSYEVAIETALGGTIQNIVTDNEATAKELIAYLKENRYGRATFLPLSSIQGRNTLENDPSMKEKGVVGIASSLVKVSFEYEGLVKYLLGRILVVDNIDNALVIARKYKYSLRIVTLEGEQLNPGGSMTGGAFKNSSNLLGRRREIEELKVTVGDISKRLGDTKDTIAETRRELAKVREANEASQKELREKQLAFNTGTMNYRQAVAKRDEIVASYEESASESERLEKQISELRGSMGSVNDSLDSLDKKTASTQDDIARLNGELDAVRQRESHQLAQWENIDVRFNALEQRRAMINDNIKRVDYSLENMDQEEATLKERLEQTAGDIEERQRLIASMQSQIRDCDSQIAECEEKLASLRAKKEDAAAKNKAFFDQREELSRTINALDKECYRLNSNKEKLETAREGLIDYMWTEYGITFSTAEELRCEELTDLAGLKRSIQGLKAEIKGLGDVNVNSIEEFKEVSERYVFLKDQHDDLIAAEDSLVGIINDLDNGMRTQFAAKFEEIKLEFDKVFRELFGGGRGAIELAPGEDILEAGITIISQPPGKKLQNMMQLSGGEKALTAISLLFAIQNLKPSPFCLLDEIEAALDDSNVDRYASYLHKLTEHTQFIVITHRRGTMSAADRLYGITMQEKGVSTLVSVDLIEDELDDGRKARENESAKAV